MKKEDIRQQLGLKSHAEHEYEVFLKLSDPERQRLSSYEQRVRDRYRQTGRTTEMLLRVIEALTEGHLCMIVVDHPNQKRNIERKLREWIDTLKVYAAEYEVVCDSDTYDVGYPGWVYKDHVVLGVL